MQKNKTIRELFLFTEALLLLAAARLILLFIPFRKITPLLGKNITAALPLSSTNNTLQQNISIAIRRASRKSPWRTACFEQALAAKIMLKSRRRVSTVYFGVHKEKTILAHAWLESGGLTVTGGKDLSRFSVIAVFKS